MFFEFLPLENPSLVKVRREGERKGRKKLEIRSLSLSCNVTIQAGRWSSDDVGSWGVRREVYNRKSGGILVISSYIQLVCRSVRVSAFFAAQE